MNYKEQLATKKWKLKRNEVLLRDNFTCQVCGSTTNLHVHHTNYFKRAKAWEYEHIWLVTLCETCHTNEHETEVIPVEEDDDENEFKDNYKAFAKATGVDVVQHPEFLEEPWYAILAAAWYWDSRKINALVDKKQWLEVTKAINGNAALGHTEREALRKHISVLLA